MTADNKSLGTLYLIGIRASTRAGLLTLGGERRWPGLGPCPFRGR
jgi:hypothetical protein